jgi:hypothetical protein
MQCAVHAAVMVASPVVDWLDNPDCMAMVTIAIQSHMVFAHEAQSSLAHTLQNEDP